MKSKKQEMRILRSPKNESSRLLALVTQSNLLQRYIVRKATEHRPAKQLDDHQHCQSTERAYFHLLAAKIV